MNGFCSKRIFGTSLTVPLSMDMTFLLFVKNGSEGIPLESHTGTTLFILNVKNFHYFGFMQGHANRYEDDEFSDVDCTMKLDEWNRSTRSQETYPGERRFFRCFSCCALPAGNCCIQL